jgi:hypothetical protein
MKRCKIEEDPLDNVERIVINAKTSDKLSMNNIKMAFYHLKKGEVTEQVKTEKGDDYKWTDLKKETDKLFEKLTIKS